MTTNSTTAEDRLAELGIHLPDAPTPFGRTQYACAHREAVRFVAPREPRREARRVHCRDA